MNPSVPANSSPLVAVADEKPVLAIASSNADVDSSSAKILNAVATRISPSMTNKPRHHVQSIDDSYSIYGVDAIWHNQYRGPNSDFIGMRKEFDCDISQLLLQVAKHIESGLYTVITMSASPHSLTVVCGSERMEKDMPDDMWDDPSFVEDDEQRACGRR